MPKRKVRKQLKINRSSSNLAEGQVNFTFFNSKLFVTLVAVALIVIAFAVISSINNNAATTESANDYRINTSNLKNDPSANQIVNP